MTRPKSIGSAKKGGSLHTVWGIFFALLGVCITLIVLFVDTEITSSGGAAPHSRLAKLALDLFTLVGMTLFTMGILTILVDTKNWKDYFETGLKNVVSGQDYLTRLSPEQLKILQINSLKAFYRGENVERERSFLIYCTENIHQYVGSPYREDVQDEIIVEHFDASSGVTQVYEKLEYVCRKGGDQGLIQEKMNGRQIQANIFRIRFLSAN